MNRLEFLKLLRSSLKDTAMEIATPIIEEEMEDLEKELVSLAGIRWHEAAISPASRSNFIWIKKSPVLFLNDGGHWRAFNPNCPACRTTIHYQEFQESALCLPCSSRWTVGELLEGEKLLHEYPMKQEKEKYYVALPK